MPQPTRYIASTLALLMIAIVAAACGSNTSDDTNTQRSGVEIQWLPTLQARQSNDIAIAPNERTLLPTVMPRATRAPRIAAAPTLATASNDGDTTNENANPNNEDFALSVAQATPEADAGDGGAGSLPFDPSNASGGPAGGPPAGNSAPPGFPGTNNTDTGTSSQSGNMPPFGGGSGPPVTGDASTDTTGGNASSPFGNSGGPPGSSSSGGGLPFGNAGDSSGGPGGVASSGPMIGGSQPVTVFGCAEVTCDVLGTIESGTSVTLTDEWGAWSGIEFEGQTGYVYTDFISDGSQQLAAGPGAQTVSGPPFGNGGPGSSTGGPPFGNAGGPPGSSSGPPFMTGGGPPGSSTGGGPPFGNTGGPPFGNTGGPPFGNTGGPPFGNTGGPPFGNQGTAAPQSQFPLPTGIGSGNFGATPYPTIAFPSGFGGN